MDCSEARSHLLGRRRGTLDATLRRALDGHLANCTECRREDAAERELSSALERALSRRRAPAALVRALVARWGEPGRSAGWGLGPVARTMAAMALGVTLAVVSATVWRTHAPDPSMVAEAVNDHLRVLYSQHPLEVESGGMHQVKPWFAGRLDFAPVTAFVGDDEFPLQGGLVGYFVDRKAATFVFKRRLHVITLFVFPAAGLRWPALGTRPIGATRGALETSRGFNVLLWRQGDLGYALVSDVNDADLVTLGAKIVGP